MKPCKECPYLKKSIKGLVSFEENRRGFYDSCKGILNPPIECHLSVSRKKKVSCRGSLLYGSDDERVFQSEEELLAHHVIYEGPNQLSFLDITPQN